MLWAEKKFQNIFKNYLKLEWGCTDKLYWFVYQCFVLYCHMHWVGNQIISLPTGMAALQRAVQELVWHGLKGSIFEEEPIKSLEKIMK